MADPSNGDTDGPTDAALRELLRAEQHRSEVEDRRRRRELHRQAAESLSLLDVLRELAGTGALAVVHTRRGPLPPSTVLEVGRDYVALRGSGREARLVPQGALASVRPLARRPEAATAPVAGTEAETSLHERLTDLALRRPQVTVATAADEASGRLCQIGVDLAVITDADGTDAFVALDAIAEVRV
jgi:hypothetical protein